jgi:hypothetical protein
MFSSSSGLENDDVCNVRSLRTLRQPSQESSHARAFFARHRGCRCDVCVFRSGQRPGGLGVHRRIHFGRHRAGRLFRPWRSRRQGYRRSEKGSQGECVGFVHGRNDVQGWARRLLESRRDRVQRRGRGARTGAGSHASAARPTPRPRRPHRRRLPRQRRPQRARRPPSYPPRHRRPPLPPIVFDPPLPQLPQPPRTKPAARASVRTTIPRARSPSARMACTPIPPTAAAAARDTVASPSGW